MRRRLHILLLAASLLLTAACSNSVEMDPVFIELSDIRLKVDGKIVFTCDPQAWQYGYNATRKEYRAYMDDLSCYYILTCKKLPGNVGERVTGDLEWNVDGVSRRKSGVRFTVKQRSEGGRIWLWSTSDNIGIVVQTLTP